MDKAEFERMIAAGDFFEYALVHGDYKGTARQSVEPQLAAGKDVLLEIDWQGAQQVRRIFPEAVTIFILPPSLAELERRLRGRGSDSEDVIGRRVAAAIGEMRHVGEFDFVIINKDLDVALRDLVAAVHAARLRFSRQRMRHPDVFAFLEQD